MVKCKYWPQAMPGHKFDTIRECREFMNSGLVPWHQLMTNIGVFIVRYNPVTGTYALFEHRFNWQMKNYKKYVQRYHKYPSDRNRIINH